MKNKHILMAVLFALAAGASSAHAETLLYCHHQTGRNGWWIKESATVEKNSDGTLRLHMMQCDQLANWGCMDTTLDISFQVTTSDGSNYVGEQGSLMRLQSDDQINYVATANSGLRFVFALSNCTDH